MKETKKFGFLEWNNAVLMDSFKKIDSKIILIIILDFLFYALSSYLFLLWHQRIQAKMAAVNMPQDVASLGLEEIEQLAREETFLLYFIIFSLILLLTTIIFLASVLKGIIWAKTTNTKISFVLISRFLILNLIWTSFWFVLVVLVSIFIQLASAPTYMLMTIIFGVYFTNTLYTIFMKEQKFKSIIKAIKLNITKIHLFLLPYIILFLLFFIIVRISSIFTFKYSQILVGLIAVIYAAIVRYYVSTLVLEVEKSEFHHSK